MLQENLISATHIELFGTICIPVILFLWDQRNRQERYHREWMDQQQKQHSANSERLVKIEAVLEPIADWWNTARAKERNGGNGHA